MLEAGRRGRRVRLGSSGGLGFPKQSRRGFLVGNLILHLEQLDLAKEIGDPCLAGRLAGPRGPLCRGGRAPGKLSLRRALLRLRRARRALRKRIPRKRERRRLLLAAGKAWRRQYGGRPCRLAAGEERGKNRERAEGRRENDPSGSPGESRRHFHLSSFMAVRSRQTRPTGAAAKRSLPEARASIPGGPSPCLFLLESIFGKSFS